MQSTQTTVQRPIAKRSGLGGMLFSVWRFCRRKPLGAVGLGLLLFAFFVAVVGPFIAPNDPWEANRTMRLHAPSGQFWFGNDSLGRDVFSRTIFGARISILVGLITTLVANTIAVTVGVTSGYYGGKFDLIVQRFVDAQSALPGLLLALALMAALGPSFFSVIIALIVIFSSRGIRIVRSQALSIKQAPYIEAARALGATNGRIMALHVLPNTFGPVMVIATVTLGAVILLEASLSFLGVGMPATIISWGGMLSGDLLRDFPSAPWIGFAPGLALTAVVFGVNTLGDALRDVLDPRLRGR